MRAIRNKSFIPVLLTLSRIGDESLDHSTGTMAKALRYQILNFPQKLEMRALSLLLI